MEDPDEPRARHARATWAVVGVLVLLLAYPLSVGPAVWICNHGYMSEDAITPFYAPLKWLVERSELVGDGMGWYVALWLG